MYFVPTSLTDRVYVYLDCENEIKQQICGDRPFTSWCGSQYSVGVNLFSLLVNYWEVNSWIYHWAGSFAFSDKVQDKT